MPCTFLTITALWLTLVTRSSRCPDLAPQQTISRGNRTDSQSGIDRRVEWLCQYVHMHGACVPVERVFQVIPIRGMVIPCVFPTLALRNSCTTQRLGPIVGCDNCHKALQRVSPCAEAPQHAGPGPGHMPCKPRKRPPPHTHAPTANNTVISASRGACAIVRGDCVTCVTEP